MIWIYAETAGADSSELAPITLELAAKARQYGEVAAVFGGDASAVADELGRHGVGTVYATGDLADRLPGSVVATAIKAALDSGVAAPDAFWLGTTYAGRDVAGRLSAKLNAPVLTNVVDLQGADAQSLAGVEPIFGGTVNVSARFSGGALPIFLVRPKSFEAEETGGPAAAVEALPAGDPQGTDAAVVTSRHAEATSGPKLDEADLVVSGGRGLGAAESFQLVEDLAKLLGGAAGASRAVVDSGWVPYSYQVGQTGKVVKPNVYIACGISGATQHLVGMKGAKHIIAINKDPEAPIFSVADLGIVGDVHKVLPKLIEALGGGA